MKKTSQKSFIALLIASLTMTACFPIASAAIDKENQTISEIRFIPKILSVGGTTTVYALATSWLPVNFSSNTPSICTIKDSIITGVSAGICTLEFSQSGDVNYNSAPKIIKELNVDPVPEPLSGLTVRIIYKDPTEALEAENYRNFEKFLRGLGVKTMSNIPQMPNISQDNKSLNPLYSNALYYRVLCKNQEIFEIAERSLAKFLNNYEFKIEKSIGDANLDIVIWWAYK